MLTISKPTHLKHLKGGERIWIEFTENRKSVWIEGKFLSFTSGDMHENFERVNVEFDGCKGLNELHPLCISFYAPNTLQFSNLRTIKEKVQSIKNYIELGMSKDWAINELKRESILTNEFWETNIMPFVD